MPDRIQTDYRLEMSIGREVDRIKRACASHLDDLMSNHLKLDSIQLKESDIPVRIQAEPNMSMMGSSGGMASDAGGVAGNFGGTLGRPRKI